MAEMTDSTKIRFLDLLMDLVGNEEVLSHPQYPECYAAIQALQPIFKVTWHADISPVAKRPQPEPEEEQESDAAWPGWLIQPEHPTEVWVTPGSSTEELAHILRGNNPNSRVWLLPRPAGLAAHDTTVYFTAPTAVLNQADTMPDKTLRGRARVGDLGEFVFKPGASKWAAEKGYPTEVTEAIRDRESPAWDSTKSIIDPPNRVARELRREQIYNELLARDSREQTDTIWVAEGERLLFFVYGPRNNSEKFRIPRATAPRWVSGRVLALGFKRDQRTRRMVRKGVIRISPEELRRLRAEGRRYQARADAKQRR